MEDNRIIIILLCIIIAILVVGVFVFSQAAKEDSNLSIADKKISVGDSLVVKLTDSKDRPIANQTVKIKLTDDDGKTIDEDITTNSKGKAELKMEENGKYSAECRFDGNGQFASSSTSDKITVKKATTEEVNDEKTSNYNSVSGLSDDGYSYYPQNGPKVDSMGQSREYAIANNMHYIPQTIDGMDAGIYVPYDSKAGCYHT